MCISDRSSLLLSELQRTLLSLRLRFEARGVQLPSLPVLQGSPVMTEEARCATESTPYSPRRRPRGILREVSETASTDVISQTQTYIESSDPKETLHGSRWYRGPLPVCLDSIRAQPPCLHCYKIRLLFTLIFLVKFLKELSALSQGTSAAGKPTQDPARWKMFRVGANNEGSPCLLHGCCIDTDFGITGIIT